MKRSLDRKIKIVAKQNQSEIITQMAVDQAVILNKITNIERRVESIEDKLEKDYATKEWVESKYGFPTKLVYWIIVTFGGVVVVAAANFLLRGGLQ